MLHLENQKSMNDEWNIKKKDIHFLGNLLSRIEYNNNMKSTLEKSIIIFNENAKKGIDFLIK
jgi:hypothetical protein